MCYGKETHLLTYRYSTEFGLIQVKVFGRPKRIFYGWVIVATGFVNQTFQSGLAFSGFGTFIVPLEVEFGWSKATLTAARSLTQFENGLLGPLEGVFIDRFGPRIMMTIGAFIFGLGMFLLGFVDALWNYYLVFVLMALGSSLGGFIVMTTAVNNWFRRKRTMALSLAQSGLGFGGMALIPILVWAQDEFGWRQAAMAAGCLVWIVAIPMSLLVRHSPERHGALPDGDPIPEDGGRADMMAAPPKGGGHIDFTLGEALRTRAFWMLGMGHGISVMAIMGASVNQFPHMEQGMELARSKAAVVVTIASAMNVAGRLGGGFLGDRFNKRHLAAIGSAGGAISLVILATADSFVQAIIFAVIMGLSWGIRGPMMSSLRGEYFGRTSFGKIAGFSSLLVMPASVSAPVFAALMADLQGDYVLAFIILAAVSTVAVFMFLFATPPLPPARLRQSV